jgi:hypothetical protein
MDEDASFTHKKIAICRTASCTPSSLPLRFMFGVRGQKRDYHIGCHSCSCMIALHLVIPVGNFNLFPLKPHKDGEQRADMSQSRALDSKARAEFSCGPHSDSMLSNSVQPPELLPHRRNTIFNATQIMWKLRRVCIFFVRVRFRFSINRL